LFWTGVAIYVHFQLLSQFLVRAEKQVTEVTYADMLFCLTMTK